MMINVKVLQQQQAYIDPFWVIVGIDDENAFNDSLIMQ